MAESEVEAALVLEADETPTHRNRKAYLCMAIHHARSAEPVSVQPLGVHLTSAKTKALFKSEQLEVFRLVLQTGKSLPPHRVAGEITIQCVEGQMDVEADGTNHVLSAGQLLFLAAGVLHSVRALQDSSALVTIALSR